MKPRIAAFGAGAVFAVGLVLAGMTDRFRVRAFLDIGGDWDPRLLLVMGFAILVFAPLFRFGRARNIAPNGARAYDLATSPVRDPRLWSGAILFGVGWGLLGYCPGPALVALGGALVSFDATPVVFVLAMLAGMKLYTFLPRPLDAAESSLEREDA